MLKHQRKTIIVNGYYLTGSTLTFNVLHQLLEEAGIMHDWGKNRHIPCIRGGWVILKKHIHFPKPKAFRGVYQLHTHRNAFSLAASILKNKIQSEFDQKLCNSIIKQLHTAKKWKQISAANPNTMLIEYGSLYYHLPETIRSIADYFGIPCDLKTATKIADNLSIDKVENFIKTHLLPQDSTFFVGDKHHGVFEGHTRYHAEQISRTKGDPNAWKEVLPQGYVDRIQAVFGDGDF